MPLYMLTTKKPFSNRQREDLAVKIVDVHSGMTGAPRTFVNVVFSLTEFMEPGVDLHIMANVRGGRTQELNESIKKAMIDECSEIARVQANSVGFTYFEIPAGWIMEGGLVLPDPGDEEEWLANNDTHHVPA